MRKQVRQDDTDFAWAEARDRVKQEARFILNRVLNNVLADLNDEMLAALNDGRIIDIEIDRAELKRRLLAVAKKELR